MKRVLEPEYMDDKQESNDYDAMDHSLPNGAFVDRLMELGASGTMLDLGCGPGHIPPMIVDRSPTSRIIGLDAAATMLEIAESHRLSCSAPEQITYQLADAKALPFEDDSFDVVMSNTVLHHIPDPIPFLEEANRVLKATGVLLIRDLFRPDDMTMVEHLVQLHASGENPEQQALFHASLCAALTPEELHLVAEKAGIKGFEIVRDSDRHMSLQRAAIQPD